MPQILQQLVIAYAFFIFGMMGGFGYLNGIDFMIDSIFEYRTYQRLFMSALVVLFLMGIWKMHDAKANH